MLYNDRNAWEMVTIYNVCLFQDTLTSFHHQHLQITSDLVSILNSVPVVVDNARFVDVHASIGRVVDCQSIATTISDRGIGEENRSS